MSRAAKSAAKDQGQAHIVLLLSLKLILLAFFILLNAISEFEEEKTRAVIESVNRTFSGTLDAPMLPRSTPDVGRLGALPRAHTYLSEIGSLFESLVPTSRSEQTERATMLRVELPAAALFVAGQDRVRPDRMLLVRRLAKAMRRDAAGNLSYTLEFVHEVAPSARNRVVAAGPQALEVRRARTLTAHLIEQGLPPEALSIGLLPGRPDVVQFVVRLRGNGPASESPVEPEEQSR